MFTVCLPKQLFRVHRDACFVGGYAPATTPGWCALTRGAARPAARVANQRASNTLQRRLRSAAEGEASGKPAPGEAQQATWVAVKAAIVIESPRSLVYRLFADLNRVKDWSASLAQCQRSESEPGVVEWKFSWQSVELEWKTRDTRIIPNQRIEWRSISGLEHYGAALFDDAKDNTFMNIESTPCTRLTMHIRYDAMSPLAAAVLRTGVVRNFVETAIRMDLNRFRDYCLRQQMLERRRARNPSG
jgi:uncharacterized membrane protein